MRVSVILPTFNERGNILQLVNAIELNIPANWSHEIIIVDDNSSDGTFELAKQSFFENKNVKVICRSPPHGLAISILDGIQAATGTHLVVMDTDFTHSPSEIPNLLHICEKYDLVSGSRFCAGGNMDSTRHYLASLFYNWLVRILLRTQIQDNLGGYFAVKREKLLSLPVKKIFFGYGDYFFRLLYFGEKAGFTIVEIPTIFRKRTSGESKSNFLKMLFKYTSAAIAVRLRKD